MSAVRFKNLTLAGLVAAENHGKRFDEIGKARQVRNTPPLVYGSMDLVPTFHAHVEGAKTNKALKKPACHAVVQFDPAMFPVPKDDLDAADEMRQRMLDLGVDFIQRTHGGRAVFSARYDRDEKGEHVVDVFFAPLHDKRTKAGVTLWLTNSKHGKEVCERHRNEIERRFEKKGFNTSPRAVSMAFQTELRDFLRGEGYWPRPKKEKLHGAPDRVDPETIGARKDAERDAAAAAEARAEAEELAAEAKAEKERVAALAAEAEKRAADLDARAAKVDLHESTMQQREREATARVRAAIRAEQDKRLADAAMRDTLAAGVEVFDGDPGAKEIVVAASIEAIDAVWSSLPEAAPRPTGIKVPVDVAQTRPSLLTRALGALVKAAKRVILAVELGYEGETEPHRTWLATLKAPVERREVTPGVQAGPDGPAV